MFLASKNKKLWNDESSGIGKAVEDSGISAVHPEKMEAFAEYLVEKLKNNRTNK